MIVFGGGLLIIWIAAIGMDDRLDQLVTCAVGVGVSLIGLWVWWKEMKLL